MIKNIFSVFRNTFKPADFNQLIFFVTSDCNLRCENCFFWKNLNKSDDLTLEETDNVADNLPPLNFLLLSGGEPFLRPDLVALVSSFRKRTGVRAVGIPTNGTLTKVVMEKAEQIAKANPEMDLFVYFSLDGLAEFHNKSRGAEKCFEKNIETLQTINKLRRRYPNISLSINTVISARNMAEIPKLIKFVKSQPKNFIDMHYFEIVRGQPKDPEVKNVDVEKLAKLYEEFILPYQETLYSARRGHSFSNKLLAKLGTAQLSYEYKTQYRNFTEKRAWQMPCLAGRSIAVLYNDGNLASCELRPQVANVKEIDYNIPEFMRSRKWKKELGSIEKTKCFCTHNCFVTESMFKKPAVVFWHIPGQFLSNVFRGYKVR